MRSLPPRTSRASARPSRDGDAGPSVAAVDHVVHALGASREAAHAAQLAQRPEALEPAGQQLVRIGLVPGVPDDAVARAVQQPMERDRQLDDAQRAAQVAAGLATVLDDALAQLAAQRAAALGVVEPLRSAGPRRSAGWSRGHVDLTRRSCLVVRGAGRAPRRPPAPVHQALDPQLGLREEPGAVGVQRDPRSYSSIDSSSGRPPVLEPADDGLELRERLVERQRRRSSVGGAGCRWRDAGGVRGRRDGLASCARVSHALDPDVQRALREPDVEGGSPAAW